MEFVVPDDHDGFYRDHPDLARLAPRGTVRVYRERPRDPTELIERLLPADVLIPIRERTPLTGELLARLPQLRMISMTGTGVASIDLPAATARGVVVTNTPGATVSSVAELTIAVMVALARRLPQIDRAVKEGGWPLLLGTELAGKHLGVIGLGDIGRRVAELGVALGMEVSAWGPTLTPERARRSGTRYLLLEELLAAADYVSVHLRVVPATRGLLGRRELERMKPTAYFINTARAALVDEDALYDLLRAGRIAGAALDVFSEEPLPPDHRWRDLEQVILTSHRGGFTREALGRFMARAVDNVLAYLDGHPQHVVNPEALTRRPPP